MYVCDSRYAGIFVIFRILKFCYYYLPYISFWKILSYTINTTPDFLKSQFISLLLQKNMLTMKKYRSYKTK